MVNPPVIDNTMCKGVQSSDPFDPIGRTNIFVTTDSVFSWVQFGPIFEQRPVNWKWYREGVLIDEGCNFLIPDPSESGFEFWDRYKVWCFWNPGQLSPGSYRVDVFTDDRLRLSENFVVNAPPQGNIEILNVEAPSQANSGSQFKITVDVRNIGSSDDSYIKIIDADNGGEIRRWNGFIEGGQTLRIGFQAIGMPNKDFNLNIEVGHIE